MDQFQQACLNHHNKLRAAHGVPALKLNSKLCDKAQKWAEHCAFNKSFGHNPDRKFNDATCGENVYMCGGKNNPATGEGATQSWYDEIKDYDFSSPGTSSGTGHFTQVVWKESAEFGVGVAENNSNPNMPEWYVCANYFPAGNMYPAENFKTNVLPKQ